MECAGFIWCKRDFLGLVWFQPPVDIVFVYLNSMRSRVDGWKYPGVGAAVFHWLVERAYRFVL